MLTTLVPTSSEDLRPCWCACLAPCPLCECLYAFLRSFRVRLKHIVRTTGWDILQLAGKFVRVLGINSWYVTHEPPPTFGLRSTSPQGMGSAPDLFHGVNGTLAELAYWKLLGTKRLLLAKTTKAFGKALLSQF